MGSYKGDKLGRGKKKIRIRERQMMRKAITENTPNTLLQYLLNLEAEGKALYDYYDCMIDIEEGKRDLANAEMDPGAFCAEEIDLIPHEIEQDEEKMNELSKGWQPDYTPDWREEEVLIKAYVERL